MGRFLNADAYASTGQGILGNNMFAYCGNSPIARADATGQYYCKISFDAFSPLDTLLVNITGCSGGGSALCAASGGLGITKSEGTTSKGISVSVAYGFAGTIAFGTTYDEEGNYGVFLTLSSGGGTPTFGISSFISKTNAPTIYDQRGWGTSMGGAVTPAVLPICVGGEYNMLLDSNGEYAYSGVTMNAGIGVGLPGEWHGTMDYTWVWGFNKKDLREWLFN